MAEGTGRSSDNLTQQSQEKSRWQKFKSRWQKFKSWFGRHPNCSLLALLSGGTLGLSLVLLCLLAAMAVAWPIVQAVMAGNGLTFYGTTCIGGLAFCGLLGAYLCEYCGRNIARLIQSSSGRVAVRLENPICWASVMIAASCGSAYSMLSPSSSWPWIWRVLLLGLCVFVLSVVLRLLWRPAKEWMGKLPLFVAIAIWAVLGIIAFLLAMWWLGRVPFWQLKLDPRKHVESIVKIALTLVGGVGAVAYLVIKYQERQQAGRAEKREKDRTVDTKVQDAINQLGSDKASTRIAGVYALTDIADTYRGGYRQRVVDILCGYLRSDRETYPLGEDGKPATGLPRSGDADKAVESTILSMFVAHLKKGPRDENGDVTLRQQVRNDQLWCDCDFDLHGAEFHDMTDFADCVFEKKTDFRFAKFTNISRFSGAKFTDLANFRGAEFKVGVYSRNTDFVGATKFAGAEFTGKADFTKAKFEGKAVFNPLRVTEINTRSTKFLGDAIFCNAEFKGKAEFVCAEFTGKASFNETIFRDGADFDWAEFRARAAFSGIQGRPSFGFEACKFSEKFRGAYEWGPIPIPEDNDGLPAGAVWKNF